MPYFNVVPEGGFLGEKQFRDPLVYIKSHLS